MGRKIRFWITFILIRWVVNICPKGKFKNSFYNFVVKNIINLK